MVGTSRRIYSSCYPLIATMHPALFIGQLNRASILSWSRFHFSPPSLSITPPPLPLPPPASSSRRSVIVYSYRHSVSPPVSSRRARRATNIFVAKPFVQSMKHVHCRLYIALRRTYECSDLSNVRYHLAKRDISSGRDR